MHIKINTDNDAFQGGNGRAEIARIFRNIADKIEAGESPRTILDVNGNTVGSINYR